MTKSLLAVVFGCLLLTGCSRADVDLTKPIDLKFTAIDGREVDLSKMRGKVVLVDFWATWCPPCRTISPDLVELYKKYHSQGLEIVGISVDTDKQALLDFVKKEGEAWPVFYDGQGVDNKFATQYGIDLFPTLFLIDKTGKVVNPKDPNFFNAWISDDVISPVTSDKVKQKIDAAIEKQLRA